MEAALHTPFTDAYCVYVVTRFDETIAFYTQQLGFELTFDSSWFLLLRSPGPAARTLGFIHERWPQTGGNMKVRAYHEVSAYLALEVEDVDRVHGELVARGISVAYPLQDEPWGQRRFAVLDPNGIYIDIAQSIEPQPGYWAQHSRAGGA